MRPIVIGNWKMNGDGTWLDRLPAYADLASDPAGPEIALCLPSTLVHRAAAAHPDLVIGGQDCHDAIHGAYTGSVSAAMLREAGARLVILGHSERRAAGDDSETIGRKVEAALAAGLAVVLCAGEDARSRDAGDAVADACRQLTGSLPVGAVGDLVVAYEPVWPIGTGRVPSASEIGLVVSGIRTMLAEKGRPGARVLYGGSVDGRVAEALVGGGLVDGLLVGKASMEAVAFGAIIESVRTSRRSRRPPHRH